jgi:hypothetical protein
VRATLLFFFGGSEDRTSSNNFPTCSADICSDPSTLAAGVREDSLFFGLGCEVAAKLEDDVLPMTNGKPTLVDAGVAAGVT